MRQVLTALDIVSQKKVGVLAHTWLPTDTKEKKFREIQKLVSEEIRTVLACNGDPTTPMVKQVERRNNLLNVLGNI